MTSPGKTYVPLWTKPYTLTVVATFFLFIPYALFLPVLPVYVLEKLHGSTMAAGAVNAVFGIAMVMFRAQTDRFEYKYGKRTVLFVAALLFTSSNFLYLMADESRVIMIIRFFSGACFAIVNTSLMALGGELSPPERKGEGLGYISTAVGVGTAIGPFAGLTLAKAYGFTWVFLLSGLVALFGSFISLCIDMPDTSENDKAMARSHTQRRLFEPRAVPASSIILLLMVAISAVLTFVSIYANGMHLYTASTYFFVVLALCTIGCRLITGPVYDRAGANYIMYPAIICLALGLLVLGKANTSFGMFVAAALIGLSYGSAVPGLQTLAYTQSPPSRTSAVAATYFTFFDIGMGTGAYLVGVCVPLLGYANLYLLLSPFILSVALLYYVIFDRRKATAAQL